MALAGAKTAASLVKPGEAEAYHFCGHIYTTDSCPHPTGLPRIDSRGYPLRARDGKRVDDLGRLVDRAGRPGRRRRAAAHRSRRPPAPARDAHARLQGRREGVRPRHAHRRRLVPLLRRQGPQARGLLRLLEPADQRRRRAHRLLLRRPQGVLRHVLPDEGGLLMLEAVLLAAGLIAGLTGAWSPCGFSMVDTLAPHGYAGRLRTTLVACARSRPARWPAASRRSAGWRCSGRRSAPAVRRRSPWPPRSRSRPPPARRAGRGSSRRSAARCRSRGAACCRCRWPPGSTGSCSGSASRPSSSPSPCGRWRA